MSKITYYFTLVKVIFKVSIRNFEKQSFADVPENEFSKKFRNILMKTHMGSPNSCACFRTLMTPCTKFAEDHKFQ